MAIFSNFHLINLFSFLSLSHFGYILSYISDEDVDDWVSDWRFRRGDNDDDDEEEDIVDGDDLLKSNI